MMMKSVLNNTRRYDISMFRNGRIDIVARIAKSLSLKDGDIIDIAQHNGEMYLYKKFNASDVPGAFRGLCHGTGNFIRVWSKDFTDIFFEMYEADSLRFACGQPVDIDGYRCIPIIYKHLL